MANSTFVRSVTYPGVGGAAPEKILVSFSLENAFFYRELRASADRWNRLSTADFETSETTLRGVCRHAVLIAGNHEYEGDTWSQYTPEEIVEPDFT